MSVLSHETPSQSADASVERTREDQYECTICVQPRMSGEVMDVVFGERKEGVELDASVVGSSSSPSPFCVGAWGNVGKAMVDHFMQMREPRGMCMD